MERQTTFTDWETQSRLCVWQDAYLISKWNYKKPNGQDTLEGLVGGFALPVIKTYCQLQKSGSGVLMQEQANSMRKEEST